MSKRLVLSACAVMLLTASAFAKPGVATTTVNLRAEANTTSDVLAKMPAGARLDVGDCTEGWCAVTFQGKSGFAIQTALDASGRPRRAAVRRGPPPGTDPDDDFEPVGPGYRPYPVAPPAWSTGRGRITGRDLTSTVRGRIGAATAIAAGADMAAGGGGRGEEPQRVRFFARFLAAP